MDATLESGQVLGIVCVYGGIVVLLISVSFLFGEPHYVVRGAQIKNHELITCMIVAKGIVVRAKIFSLHVLFVDVRQAQQLNHLRCVNHF